MANDQVFTVTPELHYRDPDVALTWLADAFGFEIRMVVADQTGRTVFAEVGWGQASVAITPEEPTQKQSPSALDGVNTQLVRIRGNFDVDAHCARSRAAGATVVQDPVQHFFGDRTYVVADLEGHLWSFAQRIPNAGGPPPDGWRITFPSRS
jgi:uncharacterized glyoxalase superfamily protein PhnB